MKLNFIKMQASGNDYLFFDCLCAPLEEPELVAQKLCKRRFGVGADGLVLLLPSKTADARMRIFNADGSEAQMCGNASRCAAKLLYESNFMRKSRIRLETNSGLRELYLTVKNAQIENVSVEMGKIKVGELFSFENNGERFEMREANVGNAHQVCFLPDVDLLDLERQGAKFEHNPRFENGVNTDFCEIVDKNHLKVRTYERGSAETYACGTGACASAAVGIMLGACDFSKQIRISMRGGDLFVNCDEQFNARLQGNAHRVFEGVAYL